jgi:ribosomal protein S18 acetylase RimI-like enzyme
MVEFVPFNIQSHKSVLIQLNEEYLSWIADEMQKRYNINIVEVLGLTIPAYLERVFDDFSSFLPPKGIYYLINDDDSILGMGALRTLKSDIGEIKRMYIKPEYRRNGFGKKILKMLIAKAREYEFSSIRLDTGKFMNAAQKVYRLAGFQEREWYYESEVPDSFLPYWLFMEKFL